MDKASKNDNARGQAGEVDRARNSSRKRITKLDRIITALETRPEGLNRFEADGFGDHCLNSAVAVIRNLYGDKLIQQWETVPSRFNEYGVRCLRFWLIREGE